MLDKEKENLSQLAETEYFGYLVEKQIKKRISIIVKENKWFLIVLGAIILFFSGYNIYSITGINAKIEAGNDKFKDIIDEANRQYLNLKSQAETLNQYSQDFKSIRAEEIGIDGKNSDLLEQRIEFLKEQTDKIFKNSETYNSSLMSLESSYKEKFEELSEIELSINNKLTAFDSLLHNLRVLSSVKYLFLERSNRNIGDAEYRPSSLILPFSKYKLTTVFYDKKFFSKDDDSTVADKKIKKEYKEAMIDIYLELNNKIVKKNSYVLREHEAQNIPGTDFSIEATFIYLPPNPLMAYRIPDFVVLKISMNSEIMKDIKLGKALH